MSIHCSGAVSVMSIAGTAPRRGFGHQRRHQHAALQAQLALAARGDAAVVRDQHERGAALARQRQHQLEDAVGGVAVEVAGGLVRQHARGARDERARDGHALALAAGQLARPMLRARAEADGLQHRLRLACASAVFMRRISSGIATLSSAENSGSRWWNW